MKNVILISLSLSLGGCALKPVSPEGEPTWQQRERHRQAERLDRLEDVLFESVRSSHVRLIGAVKSPGLFKITENAPFTLNDLLTDAHGFERGAFRRDIRVTRISNSSGKKEVFSADMSETKIQDSGNFILHPGDIIYVPETIQ
jgi:protein involved in polysaccharide export with SLBB domain